MIVSHLATRRVVIMAGDFNFVENPQLDRISPSVNPYNLAYLADKFIDIRNEFHIVDSFRILHPDKVDFTHRSVHPGGITYARLDCIYLSSSFKINLESVSHSFCPHSDHYYVDLKLSPTSTSGRQGPGYWKLNTSILEEPKLISLIENLWKNELYYMTSFHDMNWWDDCKSRFKVVLKDYSKKRAHKRHKGINELEEEIQYFTRLESIAFDPAPFTSILRVKKDFLSSLISYKQEGYKIRSKAVQLDESERPSIHFLKREYARGKKKSINKLLGKDGVVYEDIDSILRVVREFYSELFSGEEIDFSQANVFLTDIPKLNDFDWDSCEGLLSFDECLSAVKAMQNGKSPGLDGLPCEFYKKFFYLFGCSLVKLYNLCFWLGSLSPTQRMSIMTLLCKKFEKDLLLEFWRPISLLNVEFKIVSKCMSLRMRKVLPSIIGVDQSCSVMGRSIADNCHLLRNIVDYVESKSMGAALVNLDFAKAFDKVSHQYMFMVLEAFGFGPDFMRWVRILYQGISSAVLVNGHMTSPFLIGRGVRQGCACPLLYVLTDEPFARAIRASPHIKGLPLPGGGEVSLCRYADDSTVIVSSLGSITKLLELCELFGHASGARLNVSKCFGIWLGRFKGLWLDSFQGISFQPCGKILGIVHGIGDMHEENWSKTYEKFKSSIETHMKRKLTLKGKAVLLNSKCATKLWYVGTIKTLSSHGLDIVNKAINAFLWNGGMAQIRRDALEQPHCKGGIALVNIKLKLEAFLIRHIARFLQDDFHPWKVFARYWVGF